jgi:hypothetical protein
MSSSLNKLYTAKTANCSSKNLLIFSNLLMFIFFCDCANLSNTTLAYINKTGNSAVSKTHKKNHSIKRYLQSEQYLRKYK